MDKCINTYFIFGHEIMSCSEFENYNSSICGKQLYEVIRVSEGIPVFLMEHILRLESSAKIMNYSLVISRDEIIQGIINLINKNKVWDGNLKLVINYDPNKENCHNKATSESFLAYFIPHNYPSLKQYQEGVKTITYHGERDNPNAKVIDNNFREKVNQQIKSKGSYEAILIDHEGFITEGSKSNIFMIIGSMVVTSKVENVLPGITRQSIIKICKKLNILFEEKNIHEKDIPSLTGLFITGTSPNVLPIKTVDGFSFNSAKNPIINSIIIEFNKEFNHNKQYIVKFIENATINN